MNEVSKGHGTFAVSTNENFNRLPYKPAQSFRITNVSGKMVGIRDRHSVHILDDFESGYDAWSVTEGSTIEKFGGLEIEGGNSPVISGIAYTEMPTLSKESIIEVKFRGIYGDASFGFFDDVERVPLITTGTAGTTISLNEAGGASTSAPSAVDLDWKKGKDYKLSIEVHPDTEQFTADLFDGVKKYNIAQGADSTNDDGGGGGIIEPMSGFLFAVRGQQVVIDSLVLKKKESYPNEIIANGSSFSFKCLESIDEYELVNLGSEARGFGDNTESITLTGYYEV